jgi:hypothetical protein
MLDQSGLTRRDENEVRARGEPCERHHRAALGTSEPGHGLMEGG